MATKKISQLEAITEAEDSDVLVIVDVSEGTTNKITKGNLLLGSGHSVELTLDPQTYQLVLKLKNAAGTELSTQSVDLPNENAVTGIEYENGILTITKQVGEPSTVDLSPLIEGLVTESDFNTFTQTLAETIQGINETIGAINVKNGQQDEAIEENYKEITKLKEKVAEQEEIINQMPQVEDEGYDVTLNNTIKAPFTLFSPEGHSEQESTEGYNLFNNGTDTIIQSGVTSVCNNGLMSLNGTTSSGGSIYGAPNSYLSEAKKVGHLVAGTYKLIIRKVNGNISSTEGASVFYLRDSTGVGKCSMAIGSDSQLVQKDFTIDEEIDIYGQWYVNAVGWTFNNYVVSFTLVSGTKTKDFEPFTNGASPNPSYEQPIKSAGENVNLFDGDDFIDGKVPQLSNGELTNLSTGSTTLYKEINNKGDYVISVKYKISNDLYIMYYDEDYKYVGYIRNNGNTSHEVNLSTYEKYNEAKYIRVRFGVRLENITKIKLEHGDKATPYSPFGMGSITEKIVNRNWLLNGKTFTPSAGGWYDQLGTVTTSLSQINSNTNYYDLKANTNYTIKIDKYKNINAYQLAFIKNNAISAIVNTTNLANPVTFKPTANMRVWLRAQIVETNVETYFDAQLELGSTATPYIPHEEQTYSVYTQQPMRSIGDVRDVFFKNTVDSPYYDENLILNGWYERHDIEEIIVDGNLDGFHFSYTFESGAGNVYYKNSEYKLAKSPLSDGITGNILCNRLIAKPERATITGIEGISITLRSNAINVTLGGDYLTKELKNAYASENPLIIVFELKDPTNLLCTTEQTNILENIPSTFSGQTNVFSIDEVKAYLRAKGLLDLNTLDSDINNVKQAIVALGGVV